MPVLKIIRYFFLHQTKLSALIIYVVTTIAIIVAFDALPFYYRKRRRKVIPQTQNTILNSRLHELRDLLNDALSLLQHAGLNNAGQPALQTGLYGASLQQFRYPHSLK